MGNRRERAKGFKLHFGTKVFLVDRQHGIMGHGVIGGLADLLSKDGEYKGFLEKRGYVFDEDILYFLAKSVPAAERSKVFHPKATQSELVSYLTLCK